MTKKMLEYPRDNTKLNPPQAFVRNQNMGKWKRVIDKIEDQVAWQWANSKMDKESLYIMKQSNISKDDMEDYKLAMFTHAMNFKECVRLKKLFP